MFGYKTSGSFKNTEKFLSYLKTGGIYSGIDHYGKMGVDALASATPRDSGETAHSWSYNIVRNRDNVVIQWFNNHVNNGVNIAVIIQYGHGTGTGGYVHGYDYINPAIRPIFDKIAEDVWEKVRNG